MRFSGWAVDLFSGVCLCFFTLVPFVTRMFYAKMIIYIDGEGYVDTVGSLDFPSTPKSSISPGCVNINEPVFSWQLLTSYSQTFGLDQISWFQEGVQYQRSMVQFL